jgi:hypothetical protein
MLTKEDLDQLAEWLRGPTLPKLTAQIEERYVEAWKAATKPDDREHCWRMIKCLHGLVDEMNRLTSATRVEQHNASRARANNWTLPRHEERTG